MNILKLKAKMLEKGFNVDSLSNRMQIHPATMYRKFASEGDNFTIKESYEICEILGLTGNEAISIFFSKFVADERQ